MYIVSLCSEGNGFNWWLQWALITFKPIILNKFNYCFQAQTAVLTKFIQVAKICKNLRNFATCMSVKDGLDHPLLRHIPVSVYPWNFIVDFY